MSEQTQHTPGPWRLAFHGAHEADLISRSATFAGINGGRGAPDVLDKDDQIEWEANARLIAAAPELLEALEKMVNAATYGNFDHADCHPLPLARAAIAKAKER